MVYEGDFAVDDRGKVSFVNDFAFEGVKRFYVVENHKPSFVRAWHGHKNEGKYVYAVSGSAIIGVVDLETEEVTRLVLSADKPQVLWIPPNHANGFRTLTADTKIIFFSTATVEESKNDDIRFPAFKWDVWGVEER